MPRSKFQRQYLYISDAQYLASNVDLSQHYRITTESGDDLRLSRIQSKKKRIKKSTSVSRLKVVKNNRSLKIMAKSHQKPSEVHDKSFKSKQNLRLEPFYLRKNIRASNDKLNNLTTSQLDENLRLALNGMLKLPNVVNTLDVGKQSLDGGNHGHSSRSTPPLASSDLTSKDITPSSGSSTTDSGVFATGSRAGSSTSRSSSASSLSEVCLQTSHGSSEGSTINVGNNSIAASCCNCKLLYESPLFLDLPTTGHQSQPMEQAGQQTHSTAEVRERIEYGQCALDWHLDSHIHYHQYKQVALISAGMTSGSDKKYVTDTVKSLEELGYEVCVFIRRGVGGLTLSSARFFSPSKWRDFEAAIQSVKQQRPGARLVAVGFSFGSIELCRYLSMTGERSQVDAALLVSCPFDPEAGGRNMRRRALNRRIDAYLAKNLGKQLHWALFNGIHPTSSTSSQLGAIFGKTQANQDIEQQQQLSKLYNYNGSLVNLASLPKIKSLVDFEDNYNRPLQNYPNSDAYADDSRLSEHLGSIKTPTLCLSSEDDFMAPLRLLPVTEISANPNLCMLLTKCGGHMAFIDGLWWPKKPYFAQRIIKNYLGALSVQTCGNQSNVDIICDNFRSSLA